MKEVPEPGVWVAMEGVLEPAAPAAVAWVATEEVPEPAAPKLTVALLEPVEREASRRSAR
jgi:hypothetical protein